MSDPPKWPSHDSDPDSPEPASGQREHRGRSPDSHDETQPPELEPQASSPPEQEQLVGSELVPVSSSPPKRVRVVLAERKRARRVVRTLAEVEEQTVVGEMLVRNLMRTQLSTSLVLALLVVAVLGSLPLAFAYVPKFGELSVFGLRLPWLLLGFVAYPFLFAVGWVYVRRADRNERGFVKLVEE